MTMDDERFADELREVLAETDDASDHINQTSILRIERFDEVGMLTENAGLVITMKDGSQFQLTVVQARPARG